MHHRAEIIEAGEALRQQGYRRTPQRLMVLDAVIAGKGHVTAENIHQAVAEVYPDVSISTVYRTLETLRELGLVAKTDMGNGRIEYQMAGDAHHHHLICRKCGTSTQLEDDFFEPVARKLHRSYGFHAEMTHFAVFGICAACAETGAVVPTRFEATHHHQVG